LVAAAKQLVAAAKQLEQDKQTSIKCAKQARRNHLAPDSTSTTTATPTPSRNTKLDYSNLDMTHMAVGADGLVRVFKGPGVVIPQREYTKHTELYKGPIVPGVTHYTVAGAPKPEKNMYKSQWLTEYWLTNGKVPSPHNKMTLPSPHKTITLREWREHHRPVQQASKKHACRSLFSMFGERTQAFTSAHHLTISV
jgi:hypothetical protein